ncbi:hypothetical protein [Prevotella bivia]
MKELFTEKQIRLWKK